VSSPWTARCVLPVRPLMLLAAHVAGCVLWLTPAFADGYGEWRRAFDAGKAGAFTITVSEGVDFMEQVLNR
jgi:hypothetical protein